MIAPGYRCGWCYQPTATALLTARQGQEHRAAHTCPNHLRTARSWAARAGPVQQTPLRHPQEQPQLF